MNNDSWARMACRTDEYWGLFFFDGKIAMGALIIFLLRIWQFTIWANNRIFHIICHSTSNNTPFGFAKSRSYSKLFFPKLVFRSYWWIVLLISTWWLYSKFHFDLQWPGRGNVLDVTLHSNMSPFPIFTKTLQTIPQI
jgi:hypothetical protein